MGCLVLVVGPSGAGKDTLIDYARARLTSDPRYHFVRRVITRPAAAGEAHEPVTEAEFECRVAAGGFALHWHAHGLRYGIPAIVRDWLAAGHVVVTNGSRAVVAEARARFPTVQVVNVTAPRGVLAARLSARGRESPQLIVERVERAAAFKPDTSYEIDNSRSIEAGGTALTEILLAVMAQQ